MHRGGPHRTGQRGEQPCSMAGGLRTRWSYRPDGARRERAFAGPDAARLVARPACRAGIGTPPGDPLLDLIGAEWAGHERALSDLVDGWEALLGERPLSEPAMQGSSTEEGHLGPGWPNACCNPMESAQPAAEASRLWARADLAAYAGDASEREHALSVTASLPRLPRELRPLSVMGGLAGRSLRRGGVPMVGDRFSPLVALRLGLFGR